jgi:lipopolysaccharide transport system ATP-binding protein
MPSILRVCGRAILLDRGGIVADGGAHEVIGRYLHSGSFSGAERVWAPDEAPGDSTVRLLSVRVLTEHREVQETVEIRRPFFVEIEYLNLQSSSRPSAVLHFVNEDGICLFATNDFNNTDWWNTPRVPGLVRATCRVPGNFLAEGRIFVLAALCSYDPSTVHVLEQDAVSFQVIDRSQGDAVRGPWGGAWPGVMRPMLEWTVLAKKD